MQNTKSFSKVCIFIKYVMVVCLIELSNGCQFQNYEDGLISINNPIAIYNLQTSCKDTSVENVYSIGIWSFYIPLQEFDFFPQVKQPFKQNVTEDGQLIFVLYEQSKVAIAGYISFDYVNLKVIHTIFIPNQEGVELIQFIYSASNYEGTWILLVIRIDSQNQRIKFEMSGQQAVSKHLDLNNQNLKLILGGRGFIFETLNLNIFRGRLSKLIQTEICSIDENIFEYLQTHCKIPNKKNSEEKFFLIKGLKIFNGDILLQLNLDQIGKKYSLSGWVKYDVSKVIGRSIYPLIRLTNYQNYNNQKNIGDELFKLEVWLFSQLQHLSQIVVQVDAYDIPKRGNQASLAQINGQKLLFDTKNNYYYQGLQRWHYIKYEYGRESNNEKMLLQIQFYNELNLQQVSFGTPRYQSSFINSNIFFIIGGDDFQSELLQASIYDLKFEYNYQQDKTLFQNVCHYSCDQCDGPMEYNCLSCHINSFRIYLKEQKRCECQKGFLNYQGINQCKKYSDEFPSIHELQKQTNYSKTCKFGWFKLIQNKTNYICIQCPQQHKLDLLCVDCIYYPQSWYLKPVCKLDLLAIQENKDSSYELKEREQIDYDLYLIDSSFNLELNEGYLEFCNPELEEVNCHQISKFHLGQQVYVKCKPNFYYKNNDCHKMNLNCLKVDLYGNCILCSSGMYIKENICIYCPKNCIECTLNVLTNKPTCRSCIEKYALSSGECKSCGSYCLYCQDYQNELLRKNYLKCFRCIDDSKYFISFDGVNCKKNQISNCLHAFQVYKNNYQINTIDQNFKPVIFNPEIITVCGRCSMPFVYDIESQQCQLGETVNCEFGIQKQMFGSPPGFQIIGMDQTLQQHGPQQQDPNQSQNNHVNNTIDQSDSTITLEPDTSTTIEPDTSITIEPDTSTTIEPDTSTTIEPDTSTTIEPDISIEPDNPSDNSQQTYYQQYCLIAQDQIDTSIVQFNQLCSGYVPNCETCLLGKTDSQIACLTCLSGYYSERWSGKCHKCPPNLNCFQCYQQQILQQDNWKDKIRAFYRYLIENNNEHPFTLYGQSQDIRDYEIVCGTCQQGFELYKNECIPSCPPLCLVCQLINNQNKCVKCQLEQQGRRLTLYNNQCIECPSNCALCKVRPLSEVQLINPLFNNTKYIFNSHQCLKSFEDQDYFYDHKLGQFYQCPQKEVGCLNMLVIPLNLYCSTQDYDLDLQKQKSDNDKRKFQQENIDINDLTSGQSFSQFENDQFYKHAMQNVIKLIIIKITSHTDQVCKLPDNAIIQQRFSQNIFSAINVQIKFNFEYPTVFEYQKNFTFVDFQSITITGLTLRPIQNNYFKQLQFFSVFNQDIILNQINYQQKQKVIDQSNILFVNVSNLIVNDFVLQNLYQTEVKSFINITCNSNQKNIVLKNISIIDSILQNQNTFLLYLNQDDLFEMENIKLTSEFTNVELIQSISIFNQLLGNIQLTNLSILGSKIIESQAFINISNFQRIDLITMSIFNTVIEKSTLIELNNEFHFSNIIIKQCRFLKYAYGISNCNILQQGQLNFNVENITFIDNEYHQTAQIITLKKKLTIQSYLSIKSLFISNNQVIEITSDFNVKLTQSSLFYIQIQQVVVEDIKIERGYGLIDMSFFETDSLIMNDVYITQGSKSKFLGVHQYLDCQLQQVKGQHYPQSFYIYSSKYTEIKNIVIEKIQSYNSPVIAYQSADSSIISRSEVIIIMNVIAKQNLLLLTSNQNSLILINSVQRSNIKLKNLTFENNILHEYHQNTLQPSACLINAECQQCQMQIEDSNFIRNFAQNTSNSIMSLNLQQLNISNCYFKENSIFKYEVLQQHLLWGFWDIQQSDQQAQSIRTEDLSKIFNVRSEAGNGYFVVEELLIKNCSFIQSQGFAGAGFSIIAQNYARLLIDNIRFYNISTYFVNQNEFGGAIYINSNNVNQIEITITNVQAINVSCRYQGGLVYIRSGLNNMFLNMKNITVDDVYSQSGSILYVEFSLLSQYQQNIQIQDIQVGNTFVGYLNFLKLYKDIENLEESRLVFNRSLIFIEYASSIVIERLTAQNLQYESIVQLLKAQKISLKDFYISNSQITNNLIHLSLKQSSFSKIVIERCKIIGIKVGTIVSDYLCNYKKKERQPLYFKCLNRFIQSPKLLTATTENEEFKYSYCVLNQLKYKLIDYDGIVGLIWIERFTAMSLIRMSQVSIKNIECELCNNGIISLQADEKEKQLISSEFKQLKIRNCSCGISGCLILSKDQQTPINNRLLQNGQGLLLLNKYEIQIQNYVCLNNTSIVGTCLNIKNLEILIQNCQFHNNKALNQGGAIYLQGDEDMILVNSSIQDNEALIGGGIYMENQFEMNYKMLGSVIQNNIGTTYGNDVVGIPQSLAIKFNEYQLMLQNYNIVKEENQVIDETLVQSLDSLNNLNKNYIQFPSGQTISNYQVFNLQSRTYEKRNFGFNILALGLNNEIIYNLGGTYCKIEGNLVTRKNNKITKIDSKINYINLNSVYFNMSTQSYNFDDLIIYFDNQAPEESMLQLEFQCNSIRIPIYNNKYPFNVLGEHNNYKLRLYLRSLRCQYGEVKNQTDQSCHQCDSNQGQFSLKINQQQCEVMDEVSTISVKQTMLELRPGFWRPYFDTSQVSQCFNLPNNCLGGWVEGDTSCLTGHIGALCEQCDLYDLRGDGEFIVGDKFYCNSCQEVKLNILFILCITIWTLISILISVQSTIQAIQENAKVLNIINMGFAICHNRNQSAILLKMLTTYLQIIGSISTFQLQIPKALENTLNVFGDPVQTASYSLDCILLKFYSIEIHYARMLWYLTMPFIYINIFIFLYFLGVKLRILNFDKSVISTTLIYLYIYFQPCLIGGLISLISYRTISGFKWISINISYRYDTKEHLFWMLEFCLPIFLLLAICVPSFFFYGLYSNRKRLDNKQVRLRWGYLYNEYTKRAYFWEIIKIIEKESIIIFLRYYDDSIIIKATVLLLLISLYQQLNLKYKPYNLDNLNKLDYKSANICLISMALATGLYVSQQSGNYEITLPYAILLTVINFRFLYVLITRIIVEFMREKSANYEMFFDRIRECFKSMFPRSNQIPYLQKLLKNRAQQKQRVNQLYIKLKKFLIPQAKMILGFKKDQLHNQISKHYEKQIESTLRCSSSNREGQKMIRISYRESASFTQKSSYAQMILDQIKLKSSEKNIDIYDNIPENLERKEQESR